MEIHGGIYSLQRDAFASSFAMRNGLHTQKDH